MDGTVQRVRDHGRSIIDGELRRLDRRAGSGLAPDHREAIEDTLEDLLERILLLRLERLAARRPDLLPAAAQLVDPAAERAAAERMAAERAAAVHPAAEAAGSPANMLPA